MPVAQLPAAVSTGYFSQDPVFAVGYFDTLAAKWFVDVRSLEDGGSLDGWPREAGGEILSAPVVLRMLGKSSRPAVLVPLADGTVEEFWEKDAGSRAEIAAEPAEAHFLSTWNPIVHHPDGRIVSALSRDGETVLFIRNSVKGTTDSIATLPGVATGPVSLGGDPGLAPIFYVSTDAPLVAGVSHDGDLLWSVTPAAAPTPVITVSYLEEEIGENLYKGVTAFVFAAGNRLHFRVDGGVSFPADPIPLEGNASGPPAAGDLDGDGVTEIAVGTDRGVLHLFNRTGAAVTGWPLRTGGDPVIGAPAIGDFDFDGDPEVAFGTEGGNLWLIRSDGVPEEGYPAAIGGAPAAGVWMVADEHDDSWCTRVLTVSDRGAMDIRLLSGVNEPSMEWAGYQNGNGFDGRYLSTAMPAPAGPQCR